MKHRGDIDGLRCLAVLLVFVFHFFEFTPLGKAAFMGVDIFFVISGYLISSIIWQQLDAGRFSLGAFYLRRFRRLAPAFTVVQLGVLVFGYVCLMPGEVQELVKQSLSAQAYLLNFYLWRNMGYFHPGADSVPLLHCWSLAIEEQFYMLYPLLLVGVHRYARKHFLSCLLAFAIGSFGLNLYLVGSKPEAAFYLLPTRAWELVIGALIPFAEPWFSERARVRQITAVFGLGLIIAGLSLFDTGVSFPGSIALLPTFGAAFLCLAGTGEGSWLSRLLSLGPLVYIGRISYSMYLVHWPVRVFVPLFLVEYTVGWRWFSMLLAAVLSVALYHWVEDPVRRGRILSKPRSFVRSYSGATLVLAVVSVSALWSGGWRYRFSPEVVELAHFAADQDQAARVCDYQPERWPNLDGPCRLGAPNSPIEWVVIGDSHAWALAKSFSLFLEHRGQAGVLAFRHGCLPLDNIGDASCRKFTGDVGRWIEREAGVKKVVLVSIWRQHLDGPILNPQGEYVLGAEAMLAFQLQFSQTVRRLSEAGKEVIIWEPLPTPKMAVPIALARNKALGLGLSIQVSREEHEQTFGFIKNALAVNRGYIRASISPASVLCAGGSCQVEQASRPLYFDNNHPAFSSAGFYSELIEAQLD